MAEKIAIGVGKKLVGKKLNEKLNDVLGDRNKAPSVSSQCGYNISRISFC